ncbi:MAG: hypothetical protein GY810_09470 [Aureispira sp.]|nr:hypothetical protein [Aureispira sp.]
MTALFLIVLYCSIFYWWMNRSSFFEIKGLTKSSIYLIFLIKVAVGVSYGFIHMHYFGGGDTCLYFEASEIIYNTFLEHPSYYIQSILGEKLPMPSEDVFEYPRREIFWKDFGTYALVHLHAILHLFTFGYYSVFIVYIAIISLYASVIFYKIFRTYLDIPKAALVFFCFFLPSLLFWTSGFHKDVFVYLGLSLLLLGITNQQTNPRKAIGSIIGGLVIVALARYYLIALLFPATLAYWWSLHRPKHVIANFVSVYALFSFVAIILELFVLPFSFIDVITTRQHEFLATFGNSNIEGVPALSNSLVGILLIIPTAIVNVFCRPFLWECQDILQFFASVEIMAFLGLIIATFVVPKKQLNPSSKPLMSFLFFYAISNLILIGILVSNVGTIVRYRAIALGFLAMLLLNILDFQKIKIFNKTPIRKLPKNKAPKEKEEMTMV